MSTCIPAQGPQIPSERSQVGGCHTHHQACCLGTARFKHQCGLLFPGVLGSQEKFNSNEFDKRAQGPEQVLLEPSTKIADGICLKIAVNTATGRFSFQHRPQGCWFIHCPRDISSLQSVTVLPLGDLNCPIVVNQNNGHWFCPFLFGMPSRILGRFPSSKSAQISAYSRQVYLTWLMTDLCFVIHPSKSEFNPTQYSGRSIHLHAFIDCQGTISSINFSIRWWMSLLNKLTSLQDMTYRGRLQLRPLQSWINALQVLSRDTQVSLPHGPSLLASQRSWNVGIPLTYPPPADHLFTDILDSAHMDDLQIQG